jgi:hypothetical protein
MSFDDLPSSPSLAEYRLRDMCPPTSRSGTRRVMPKLQKYVAEEERSGVVESRPLNEVPHPGVAKANEREAMRAHLESLRLRGANPGKALAEYSKSKAYAEFMAAFRASGLTISDLARRIGKSRQYVHDMVHERRDIPKYVMIALSLRDEDIDAIGA